ncbi:hypothetical protein KI387_038884, partial [Taxus chinensis]
CGFGEMDAYEATRIVFSRIQSLEPENVSKIMGYLLLQDHGEKEMIRLAFSPETLIQSLIVKAKKDLGLMQQQQQGSPTVQSYISRISRHNLPLQPLQISQVSSRVFPSPTALSPHAPPWGSSHINSPQTRSLSNNFHLHPNELHPNPTTTSSVSVSSSSSTNNGYLNFSLPDQVNKLPFIYNMENPHGLTDSEFQLQDQLSYLTDSAESPSSHGNYLSYPEMVAYCSGNQLLNMDHMSPTANSGLMSKRPSSIADICNTPDAAGGSTLAWKPCMYFARGYCKNGSNCRFLHSGGVRGDNDYSDEVIGSSNGSLEKLDLELQELLRGRRSPVSLPQLYSERFGKPLQAEMRYRNERDLDRSLAPANPGSRQIYLTFPAESTFKEEDVSNYFSIFGPVQDVRIPYQQKRMFGFVTFVYQETVKIILGKGNPHYVCDARVLVKPYREKGSKLPVERKYSGYMMTQNMDIRDCNLHLGPPRLMDNNSDVIRRQLEEQELEQAIELQARRLAELQLVDRHGPKISLAPKSQENQFPNGQNHFEEEATASEDISSSVLADHFAYLLQVLDSEPNYEERPKQIDHHQD